MHYETDTMRIKMHYDTDTKWSKMHCAVNVARVFTALELAVAKAQFELISSAFSPIAPSSTQVNDIL
jgi:hypothetical protein